MAIFAEIVVTRKKQFSLLFYNYILCPFRGHNKRTSRLFPHAIPFVLGTSSREVVKTISKKCSVQPV